MMLNCYALPLYHLSLITADELLEHTALVQHSSEVGLVPNTTIDS